jgi:hypothetical protein
VPTTSVIVPVVHHAQGRRQTSPTASGDPGLLALARRRVNMLWAKRRVHRSY